MNQGIPVYIVSLTLILNVYIYPVVSPHLLGRYFNACSSIENYNMMRKSDLVLDKCWVTQSVYFILETTVALGMGITDGKLLLCNNVPEVDADKKNFTRDSNNRTVYDCFNNLFTDFLVSHI